DDLLFGKTLLHVQSPCRWGLDSRSPCYSKAGGRRHNAANCEWQQRPGKAVPRPIAPEELVNLVELSPKPRFIKTVDLTLRPKRVRLNSCPASDVGFAPV
ncbi:hypothetical protein, partial [Vulcaniibacterium thermophilum]